MSEDLKKRRRKAFRKIRKEIQKLDPRVNLRSFTETMASTIGKRTGSECVALVMHFVESTRDYFLIRPARGDSHERLLPIAVLGEGVTLQGEWEGHFGHPQVQRLADEIGLKPGRVLASRVLAGGRPIATLELVDPDPSLVPDLPALRKLLVELAASIEVAFLSSRLRRERLESRLLQQVSRELGRTLDRGVLIDSILDLLNQVVPYDAAAVFVLDGDGLDAVNSSVRGYPEGSEGKLHLKLGQGIVGAVVKSGAPELVSDVLADPRYVPARSETRSELVAPLKSGGRVLGAFNLELNGVQGYTQHDLNLLLRFAEQAAVALERAVLLDDKDTSRRLEEEVRIARRIQRSFLPRITQSLRSRGLAGQTISSLEVSGDYFDFVERDDGSVLVAVADVSGKGVPAALIMSSIRSAFHLASRRPWDPAVWCKDMNELLCESLRDIEFVTGVFGVLSPDQTRFYYCNAGHNYPVWLHGQTGKMEWLETGGTILGSFPEAEYESAEILLSPGDRVVLYTDGVTEARNSSDVEFETGSLLRFLKGAPSLAAHDLVDDLIADVRRFSGVFDDDLTVAVLSGPSEAGRE